MGKSNTKTSTDDLSTKKESSLEEILGQYIKHPNGAIFQVLANPNDKYKCFLYSKNKYTPTNYISIRNGLVSGDWLPINIHELKKHLKSEEEFKEKFTHLLVKRILLSQLLIELDDELKDYMADCSPVRKLLDRQEPHFKRLLKEQYEKFYETDKQIVMNFLKQIDGFVDKCSKVKIEDFYFLDKEVEKFVEDPEKYKTDTVILDVIDA